MAVHSSGYYAWKAEPASARDREDQRLLGLIKHAWLESGGVYGYRKITHDLRDLGEPCGKHRVYRLMRRKGYAPRSATAVAPTAADARRWSPPTSWNRTSMSKHRIRSG